MGMIPIQCTECGGLSQIDDAWLGQQVECPHCRRPTIAAVAKSQATNIPPPPPSAPPSEPRAFSPPSPTPPEPQAAKSEPAPALPKRQPLTRAQREAIRQRRHLILALGGAVILLLTAYFLMSLNSTPID
jgi:hypothetical protein